MCFLIPKDALVMGQENLLPFYLFGKRYATCKLTLRIHSEILGTSEGSGSVSVSLSSENKNRLLFIDYYQKATELEAFPYNFSPFQYTCIKMPK